MKTMGRESLPRHLKARRAALVANGELLNTVAFEKLQADIQSTPGFEWYSRKHHSNWLGTQRRNVKIVPGRRATCSDAHKTRRRAQGIPHTPPLHEQLDAVRVTRQNVDLDSFLSRAPNATARDLVECADAAGPGVEPFLDVCERWYAYHGRGVPASQRLGHSSDGPGSSTQLPAGCNVAEFPVCGDVTVYYPYTSSTSYTTAALPPETPYWPVEQA
ncbi:hypothetical protein ACG7TL_008542 [Trametes sanguinea]